jgi:GT2 family glycosyltransferase
LQTLVAFLDTHPQVGAAGPRLLNSDGSLQLSCHPLLTPTREFWRLLFLDRLLPRATYPIQHWGDELVREVEVIKGACLVLRHDMLDEIGLLDERYFLYTEEMDLCHRMAQAGWMLCWVPQASVVHHGAASTRQAAEAMYLQLYRSKIQFQRKFWGPQRARWFKILIAVAYAPRWALFAAARIFDPSQAARARIYASLLAQLRYM